MILRGPLRRVGAGRYYRRWRRGCRKIVEAIGHWFGVALSSPASGDCDLRRLLCGNRIRWRRQAFFGLLIGAGNQTKDGEDARRTAEKAHWTLPFNSAQDRPLDP